MKDCFKSTCIYKLHRRLSDSSTIHTSRRWPKYKKCRKVKSTKDGIHCDGQRTVREAEMAGISKPIAQHSLTSACTSIQSCNRSLNHDWFMNIHQKEVGHHQKYSAHSAKHRSLYGEPIIQSILSTES